MDDGVAENVVGLFRESMTKWKTVLSAGGEELGKINIKRVIFQGDSLSPLLFVMGMAPLSILNNNFVALFRTFSTDFDPFGAILTKVTKFLDQIAKITKNHPKSLLKIAKIAKKDHKNTTVKSSL